MTKNLSYEDLSAGEEMLLFAKELFPMNRSLMGPDIRKSYAKFRKRHNEFKQIEFNTGDKVRIMESKPISKLKRWVAIN